MSRKTRFLLLMLLAILILLDWAALDDIATGKEPSLLSEYLMLIVSTPILLAIGYFLVRKKKTRLETI
ncbi:MAG: hypothetical protein HY537_17285 [Deltaproteobacteria bacterium]|nr:hypothetical protein [Deltaproteobacteria bacterium]